ncbi:MAG: (deoxy)nucleoside triphosphate pyrophosphohydrolase [Alkalicoccus sp.]|nr:MAG: (deoxy)nucleoside triphosphate pyrophosphohydrolase [Alkalicoccus sp.]
MKKKVKVAAAVIEQEGKVLCALRSAQMSLPNVWEFPGGKVEEGESLQAALEREIEEELGCTIKAGSVFHDYTHEYEAAVVQLIALRAELIEGAPYAREHERLLWLPKESLSSLVWAPADVPAVNELQKEKAAPKT